MDYETRAYLRALTKDIVCPQFTLYFRNQKFKVSIYEGFLVMTREAFEACINDNDPETLFEFCNELRNAPKTCSLPVSQWMGSVTRALSDKATATFEEKETLGEIGRCLSARIAVCLREYLSVKLSQQFDAQITRIHNKKRKLDEMLATNVVKENVAFENLIEQ